MFLDKSRQRPEGFIGLVCTWEGGRHIWVQNYNSAASYVTRCVFVGAGAAEVVLREDVVRTDRSGASTLSL